MIAPLQGTETKLRVPSGIAGLDTLLGGGFMLGGIYIVQGSPGAGKTIMTNQICFNHAALGGHAVVVTLLAENHARLLDNLRRLTFFDESIIPDRLIYLSAFTSMRDEGLGGLSKLLRREIQRRRTSLLVIDGFVSVQASSDSDQAFREFVHGLQEIALATDCTMLLTTNDSRSASPEQTMVDGLIVLSDRNYGWQAASDLQVTKFRGSGYLRGRHSYKISDQGIAVYPRIEALYAHPSREDQVPEARVATGVRRLDEILGGGLPAASTTMLVGPSGIGKTTLGLHFMSLSTAEQPGLMFGFYETPARLRVKGERFDPRLGALLDQGIVELLWQTPTGDLLDAYGEQLLAAVRRRQVKRLFIDGLTAFQNSAIDATRIGNFFSALANELRVLGVTTIYTLEVPDILGQTIRMPINDASSLAENMIMIRFVEKRSHLHRLLSVLKVRDSDFDASVYEFSITEHGVSINATAASAERILGDSATDHRDVDVHAIKPSDESTKRGS
jgi:circadian clock protein KaiC